MDGKGSSAGSFFMGVLVGGAVGAVVALLLAPKSGSDLRKDLVQTGEGLLDKAGDLLGKGAEKADDTINEGRLRAQRIVTNTKQQAESILSNAEHVLSEARLRAQAVKERVESFKSENDG